MGGDQLIRKAYEAILQGDYEQAVACFDEAIALEPTCADYYYKGSITCTRSGKWKKALQYAQRAVQLEPDQVKYRYHLQTVQSKELIIEAEALLSAQPEQTTDAIIKLRRAAELDPLSTESFLLLGALYNSLGLHEQAAAYAGEALRLDPQHSTARKLYAEANSSRKKSKSDQR